MKIEACIFDLDGVLVDTARYHFVAWKKMAEELGIEFTEEHNERLKGVSRMRSLDIILEIGGITLDEERKMELATRKNNLYRSFIEKMTPDEVLPGVLKFLEGIKAKGIKIALGSASKNAPTIIEKVGIARFFDAIMDGNNISRAKPDPEVFVKGAEALGITPGRCVVFEDAEAGVKAAKNGGMACVGIGSKQILKNADWVVDGFKGLSFEILSDKLFEK